jgi:hypothetical protein
MIRLLTSMLCVVVILTIFTALTPCNSLYAAKKPSRTLKGSSILLVKKHLNKYKKFHFSKSMSLGNLKTYRKALSEVKITIDPNYSNIAKYDADNKIIILKKDPRKVKGPIADKLAANIWHEVTHRIEDQHGDIGYLDSVHYAERNIEYMEHVEIHLDKLVRLEKTAKKSGSQRKMLKLWNSFLINLSNAYSEPIFKDYPPDFDLLRDWMGFRCDVNKIKKYYKSGKAGGVLKRLFSNLDGGEKVDPSKTVPPIILPPSGPCPISGQDWYCPGLGFLETTGGGEFGGTGSGVELWDFSKNATGKLTGLIGGQAEWGYIFLQDPFKNDWRLDVFPDPSNCKKLEGIWTKFKGKTEGILSQGSLTCYRGEPL